MKETEPRSIDAVGDLESVLDAPLAVLYKHSPLCGVSAAAARQVRAFMEDHPAIPVYVVDVIRARPLAREVTRRLSIRHESPQVFVLRSGRVLWNGSHGAVTAEALAREVADVPTNQGEDA